MLNGQIKCKVCETEDVDAIIVPSNYKDHIISGPRCVFIEKTEKLYDLTEDDGYEAKIHQGYKKDSDGNVFQKEKDIWIQIGEIRDNHVFLYNEIDLYDL